MITANLHDAAKIVATANECDGTRWVSLQFRNQDGDRLFDLAVFTNEFPETFGPALAEAINSVVAAHAKVLS